MGRIAPRLGLLLAVCLLLASVQRALAESPDTNAIQALREELAQLREELKEQ